jgi:hypothetical protein
MIEYIDTTHLLKFRINGAWVQFSTTSHDHSGVYSPVGHDHAGVYSPVGHNHDSAYSAVGHTHVLSEIGDAGTAAGYNVGVLDGDIPVLGAGDKLSAAILPALADGIDLLKTADQAITSSGWISVTDLSFTMTANKTYRLRGTVIFQSSTTAMGVLIGYTGPAATINALCVSKQVTVGGTAAATMFQDAVGVANDTAQPNSTAEPAANTNQVWFIDGMYQCGGSGGTFAIRFNKENVAGTATIKIKSYLNYKLMD